MFLSALVVFCFAYYLREEGGWDKHLHNSINFILQSINKIKSNSAVILGSGWLLDVPIDKLSEIFDKVFLIDIAHPNQIRHKVKKYKNVSLIEFDLTGGVIELAYKTNKDLKKNNIKPPVLKFVNQIAEFLPTILNFGINEDIEPDFVASVNLLNQLDIIITDYLNKNNIYSDAEIVKVKKQIQKNHIESLPKSKSCLITDYEEVISDFNNVILKTKSLIFADLPKSIKKEQWTWEFDKKGTYNNGKITQLNVLGITI